MNIALLGGSFDPPHIGHLFVAQEILKQTETDQVWLVPCLNHPFQKHISEEKHRLAMVQFLETSVIKISEFELQQNNVSYSIDTLRGLSRLYPQHHFSWIIGSDQASTFTKWKEWEHIVTLFGLIIFPRFENSVSSTIVRQRIQNGESIHSLVPKPIQLYIIKHSLYGKHI